MKNNYNLLIYLRKPRFFVTTQKTEKQFEKATNFMPSLHNGPFKKLFSQLNAFSVQMYRLTAKGFIPSILYTYILIVAHLISFHLDDFKLSFLANYSVSWPHSA